MLFQSGKAGRSTRSEGEEEGWGEGAEEVFSAVSCGGFVKVPGGQDFHTTKGRVDEAEARRVGGVDRSLPLRDSAIPLRDSSNRDGAGLVPAVEMRLCVERVCLLAASHTVPSMLEGARGRSGGQASLHF